MRVDILNMREEYLTDALIQQLIKYMPTPQQLTRLEEYRDDSEKLHEAERFALTLGSIKRLEARLKSTCFKIKFSELVQDIKPDIVAATAACDEVKKSKRFATILRLVLLFGNYMNSGSRNGEAFGFEISYLPKLSSTKAQDNRTTLLHFLTEIVEQKHPDCLNFHQDLHHVDLAARVSFRTFKGDLCIKI
ncbi:protein diaphanous-like [Brevipalpus obovatus]|uniref:protein diaphanous-like n=1 Tax=Brevipalpus obovatus TaxID=246614 RepID=UPI003D9E5B8B